MDTTLMGLAWDLPNAVAVRHRIDPDSQVLTRVVSDATGELERADIPLEHACVSCALREDILPTLERLASEKRWATIIACLPVGAEAANLAGALARTTRLARTLWLTNVVASLSIDRLEWDLTGDDLLRERGHHSNPWDDRGVAEVACSMVEYADVVTLSAPPGEDARAAVDLVRALSRPDTVLVPGTEHLTSETVLERRHHHPSTTGWTSPTRSGEVPRLGDSRAWRLELSSPRPFHPGRLLDDVERLGGGSYRSRGCFWLPTRPGMALHWDGAGGQLSFGNHAPWDRATPESRLLFTGIGAMPEHLVEAYEHLLLTPEEALLEHRTWSVSFDGLEPWLGDTEGAA